MSMPDWDEFSRISALLNLQLSGLFHSTFGVLQRDARAENLERIYQNKPLMLEAALAFVVIFKHFLNDPDYCVLGISEEGVEPAP